MAEGRDPVFVTGATGFIGRHVLDALVAAGYPARVLVRPGRAIDNLPAGCSPVEGDLRRPGDLAPAIAGCRYLVHVAALYTFGPRQRGDVWATNVIGTSGLLEAAQLAGVERAVVTSSSATVGPARGGRPATESDRADVADGLSAYHGSKIAQERAAFAARIPTVLVLPTMPVGPGDARPTPTGKMIVDFMRGRMFASLPGGMNVVPVEDVARGHVLALERGRPGERYLLGGENLPLARLWALLAQICGRPVPRAEIPYRAAWGLGWLDEVRCRLTGAQPLVPLEGVHMARHNMFVNWDRARTELGYEATPVAGALERAVDWYRAHGYADDPAGRDIQPRGVVSRER